MASRRVTRVVSHAVGRFQRRARVRGRRALVRRGRGGGARRLLLLPRRRQQLLLLAPGVRALAVAPARLHSRRRVSKATDPSSIDQSIVAPAV